MGPHEIQIVAAPGLWLLQVRGCSRSVAAPGPWLHSCWSPGLLAAGLLAACLDILGNNRLFPYNS